MKNNFILMTDSYKLSHHGQYPKNTIKIYSYLESRGGLYPETVFFGLQYYLKEYLSKVIITKEMVKKANEFSLQHFGLNIFNYDGWMYIATKLNGKLPIRIKAVKEGTLVPVHNVLMTIENTDPNCAWLTNHCETLLMKLWAPITVATNSFYAKRIIKKYMEETGGDFNNLPFKLHDFGYRGVSSEESAGILGMAHLTSFAGTDTLNGIIFANKYYKSGVCGFSVPASEHSVACSFGKNQEEEYFVNMLTTYPSGIVSIVSDTYDVFNFVKSMSERYKNTILKRNGKVVFRPDSGDPVFVNLKLINILWEIFGEQGSYVNGYKLLPPQVGLIQGDGINNEMIEQILSMAKDNGFSADNWVFGSGGALLQKFDRDTQKFAIKASYGEKIIDNKIEEFYIQKNPITAIDKSSKTGKLILCKSDILGYKTLNNFNNADVDELELVFENGEIKREQSFDEIRCIANSFL